MFCATRISLRRIGRPGFVEEEPLRRNHGGESIMWEESLSKSHRGAIIEEELWRRIHPEEHGGEIDEESIMEEESLKWNPQGEVES